MGRDLDLGDVVHDHPEAKKELDELHDELDRLRAKLAFESRALRAALVEIERQRQVIAGLGIKACDALKKIL